MPFGGLLGSTFNFVFETQLETLQNGDRFYYLSRTAGLHFGTELENNSFAKLVMLNTDVTHLPNAIFSTPTFTLEVDQTKQYTGLGVDGRADPTGGITINGVEITPLVIRDNPDTAGPDTQLSAVHGRRPRRARRHGRQRHHHLRAKATTRSTAMPATTGSKAATATTPSWAATATTSSRTWAATTIAGRRRQRRHPGRQHGGGRPRQHHSRRRRQGLHHHHRGHLHHVRRPGRRLHLQRQDQPAADRQRRRRLDRERHAGRRARRQLRAVPGRRRDRQRHLHRRWRLRRDDRRRRRRHLRRQRCPGQDGRHVRLRLDDLQERPVRRHGGPRSSAIFGGVGEIGDHIALPFAASPASILDRFAEVEGLSGTSFTDILRGDNVDAVTILNHGGATGGALDQPGSHRRSGGAARGLPTTARPTAAS